MSCQLATRRPSRTIELPLGSSASISDVTIGNIIAPANERQARALLEVAPEHRAETWAAAVAEEAGTMVPELPMGNSHIK